MGAGRRNFGWAVALELAPAALFGCAMGGAVAALAGQSAPMVAGIATGLVAFFAAWQWLKHFGSRTPVFPLPHFEQVPLERLECDGAESGGEMGAAEDPLPPPPAVDDSQAADELLLEDIVRTLGPGSRVVRLFPAQGSTTAGELEARIDGHLGTSPAKAAPPDATQALHEAIAELRRSLR